MTQAFHFPVLIGDIGGTNARFAQINAPFEPLQRFPDVQTADFATFSDALREATGGGVEPPRDAVIALAGPVTGDSIELTNAPWVVEPKVAIERLNLQRMVVLNDFEAQSLSLPVLADSDLLPLGDGKLQEATKVVVGPGTGLGAGALIRVNEAWVPVPGEGGHIDLGPMSERDMEIWQHIDHQMGRVSAEMLLSGSGLVRLYDAVRAASGAQPRIVTPETVTDEGLRGSDPFARETLDLFATYLGRVAGNLALIFMARGGVYLAGGIPGHIAPILMNGGFREAFRSKAPHADLMDTIATVIVNKTDPALAGIEGFVRRPGSFVLDIEDRTWTA